MSEAKDDELGHLKIGWQADSVGKRGGVFAGQYGLHHPSVPLNKLKVLSFAWVVRQRKFQFFFFQDRSFFCCGCAQRRYWGQIVVDLRQFGKFFACSVCRGTALFDDLLHPDKREKNAAYRQKDQQKNPDDLIAAIGEIAANSDDETDEPEQSSEQNENSDKAWHKLSSVFKSVADSEGKTNSRRFGRAEARDVPTCISLRNAFLYTQLSFYTHLFCDEYKMQKVCVK